MLLFGSFPLFQLLVLLATRFVFLALFVTLAFPVPNSFLLFFFVSFTSSFSFQCFVVLHVIFVSCTCSSSFVPHTRSHSGLSVRSLTTYILETSCCLVVTLRSKKYKKIYTFLSQNRYQDTKCFEPTFSAKTVLFAP